nr:hypothetical protein [Sedimentibacter sp.]
MSKGNGRHNKSGEGNSMDKFNGTCNGVTNENKSNNQSEYGLKHKSPNSNDNKLGAYNTNSYLNSTDKFKNK